MVLKFSRFARRAILIYAATVVLPIGALLWLGLQSFERQREAVDSLTQEKIAANLMAEARTAAARALSNRADPMIGTFFVIERGRVIEPAPWDGPRTAAPSFF